MAADYMTVMVASDPGVDVLPAIRRAVAELDPNLPLMYIQTMSAALSDANGRALFNLLLLVAFAGLAIALAAVGLAAALASAQIMSSLLYDVAPRDPIGFIVVPIVVVAVGMFAMLLPARRAIRIAPASALKGG